MTALQQAHPFLGDEDAPEEAPTQNIPPQRTDADDFAEFADAICARVEPLGRILAAVVVGAVPLFIGGFLWAVGVL